MGSTLAEKILASKSGRESVRPGEIVWATPSVAMLDDPLGPIMIHENLKKLGNVIKHPENVVVISDHCAPPATPEHANLLKFTREWAQEYGISRFHEFEGICHQLLVEKGYVLPGDLVVGTDSHTVMGGALGALATGIGSTEMLGVLLTGEMWFRVPETVRIEWSGPLPTGVMAKDLILRVIGDLGSAGLTYEAAEFGGDTIRSMPVDQRLCLSNMVVEAGAKAGIIEADEVTEAYFIEKFGESRWTDSKFIHPDSDAVYVKTMHYRAQDMEPVVAAPHNPENLQTMSLAKGQKIHQAYIGSCAGGRLSDIAAAAQIMQGRRVASDVRMIVCPASRSIYQDALKSGLLEILYESGAIITAAGCGACAGGHSGVLGAREVCISSTNRNFKGRMGDGASEIYLASPLSVAAAAVTGRITDPREFLA